MDVTSRQRALFLAVWRLCPQAKGNSISITTEAYWIGGPNAPKKPRLRVENELTTLLPILLSMSISTVTPQATLRVPRGVGWSGHVDHKYYHKVYTAMSKQVLSELKVGSGGRHKMPISLGMDGRDGLLVLG